jgi:hypothetical protein
VDFSKLFKNALLAHTFTKNILNKSLLEFQFVALAILAKAEILLNPIVFKLLIMNFFQIMEKFSIVKHLIPNHIVISDHILRRKHR